jgi:hypothetical protein
MSSEQCAQNPDGSLKDPKDIQWFNDPDDAQPLPNPTAPAQPPSLGRGRRNKTTNRFLDAVAHEQLDSDQEPNTFIQLSKRKRAARVLNISGTSGARPLSLASGNPFKALPIEEPSDDKDDGSFKLDCGSESGDNSSDGSTPELAQISNDEVRAQCFSRHLKYLPNTSAAR